MERCIIATHQSNAHKPKVRYANPKNNVRAHPGREISSRGTVSAMLQVQRFDKDERLEERNETIMAWALRAIVHQTEIDTESKKYKSFSRKLNEKMDGMDTVEVINALASSEDTKGLLLEYMGIVISSMTTDIPSVLAERYAVDSKKADRRMQMYI
jgi:hypothetical protein